MGLMQRFLGTRTRATGRSDGVGARALDPVEWDPLGTAFERRARPEQMARIRAANREAALAWADAVRAGTMSRAQFDQVTQQAVWMRQLLPEHLQEAVARLDG